MVGVYVSGMHPFHIYLLQGNVLDKRYDTGIYGEHMRAMMEGMLKKGEATTTECINQWKCAPILQKYENLNGMLLDRVYEVVKPKASRFNVLCHGDMWSNNVMFKYNDDTDKAEDCILVDFQMCHYGTPMLDLAYFIYSSTQHELKMTKVDHMLQFYHQQLVASLRKLGYKQRLPTLLDFQRDFLEVGDYAVMTSFGTLSIVLAPASEDADIASMMSDDGAANFQRRTYLNPSYVRAMDDLVPYFELKGYFHG